ncbi:MAG: hypothetical protein A3E01_10105 [Gammaproteobacteria bacterium RIFCSPHIGHO2_12_FULL_63_22]|nr:MAG: hypothetical protein A3E01_10105 [Gammaproteobacteria bacterium RIFCSPHIGHO2_12_FULL_63_22]
MNCPRCQGFLQVEEYAYGEPPAVRCVNCGWRPVIVRAPDPVPPRAPMLSAKALRYRRSYQCKRLAARTAKGLCRACPNLREPGKMHCRKCLTRQAKRAAAYYQRNRASVHV